MNPRFFKNILLPALWFAVLGAFAAPGQAMASPKLVVGETTRDFGTIMEGQPISHTFVIQNKGDAPLKILEVDPDCACTVASYDESIPAGGQGKITLGIKPYTVVKGFKKKTKVRSNDPARREVVLVMTGMVQPLIEIQPSHIIRFRGDASQEMRGQVRFISHQAAPFEIKETRTSIPDKIEVSVRAEEQGRVYVLEVKNRQREGGRYAGLIEVFTTSKERPRLLVRVFADLYPPSAGNP